MNAISKLLLIGASIALSTSAASAASIIGLYNTGVDSSGAVLTGANASDTHYLVNGVSTFTTNNDAYIQSSNATYIASAPNGGGGSETYSLSFDLGSLNPTTATLSGQAAYDNGVTIFLNGHELFTDVPANPGTYTAFQTLHDFSALSADFVAGTNRSAGDQSGRHGRSPRASYVGHDARRVRDDRLRCS